MGKPEGISSALNVHMKEYEMLKNSIEQELSMQHQLSNYAIAITAGVVSLLFIGEPSIANQAPAILLVVSIILTFICFAIIDLGYSIQDTSTYIEKMLKGKIQKLVSNEDMFEFKVLEWEELHYRLSRRLAIRGITSMGKYAVGYIPALGMIAAFWSVKDGLSWSIVDKFLFSLAVIAALSLPIVGAVNVIFMLRRSGKED
jgi:hypothetical protein